MLSSCTKKECCGETVTVTLGFTLCVELCMVAQKLSLELAYSVLFLIRYCY